LLRLEVGQDRDLLQPQSSRRLGPLRFRCHTSPRYYDANSSTTLTVTQKN
jgi:hypothetical protein